MSLPSQAEPPPTTGSWHILDAVPLTLALLAESAWICVYAAFLDPTASQRPTATGALLLLFTAALVGRTVAKRRSGRAVGTAIVACGVVGWLLAPGVIAALRDGQWLTAMTTNLGGWLAAVAAWRGSVYGSERGADDASTDVLGRGLVLLVVPWLAMAVAPTDVRKDFMTTAFPATLLFMTTALLASGMTRLRSLAQEAGVDWRHNRAWMVMIGGVVALMASVGIPAALLLGEPVTSVIEALAWPFLAVFAVVMLVGVAVVGVPLSLILHAIGVGANILPPEVPSLPSPGEDQALSGGPGPMVTVVLFAVMLGILVLIGFLIRKLSASDLEEDDPRPAPTEERHFLMPRLGGRRPHLPTRSRDRSPRPASDAYLAAIAAFAPHDLLRRGPAETPAGHARRVAARVDPRAMSLLAADYELEEYGTLSLSAAEVRRAKSRSARLRELVNARR
jgi:Domain of unknown function (DUF4129)